MILSVGEALIDIKNNEEFVGGGPLNVALATSRLKSSTMFVGGISSDRYGSRILNFLIDNCILFDSCFCSRKEPTATAGVTIKDGKEDYFFNWKNTSGCFLDSGLLEEAFGNNTDINAVFFGSLTYSIPSNSRIMLDFINNHKEVVSFFDPNIRPKAIDDFEEYENSLRNACKIADIVKVSEDDLAVWGIKTDELFSICKHHLIVTRGEHGAVWYSKDLSSSVTMDGMSVPVADTIGCGDCFSGAILHWLDVNGKLNHESIKLSESDINSALFFAVSVSAMNATREGCNPPGMDELV